MMNKTVKELRVIARELGVAKYYSLNKSQLIEAIEEQELKNARLCQDSYLEEEQAYEYSDQDIEFEELPTSVVAEQPVQSNRTISMFDIKRYAKFVPYKSYIASPISPKQLNLVKSLEINFKVSIDTKSCNNFYELSMKLSRVYNAILEGKVEYRSEQEIADRLKGYKASVKTVQPIVEPKHIQEVAVSTTSDVIETKLQDTTFRTKFQTILKRMFA